MRIVIVADTYPPVRISGAVQMRDLVREFANQGHEPTVVVPTPRCEDPFRIEQAGRVTVLRVRTPPTKDVNYLRRTINEMRLPHALLRGMRAAGLPLSGWEGVVWYSPTIFLGPIVERIRRASGCRSYLILRDIFPEWAVDVGLMGRGLPYRFFKWIERGQYAVADVVGVQCEANLSYLKDWAKQPNRTLEVLENWLSPSPVGTCRINISKTALANRQILVYAGNMGVAQGIDVFIEMAAHMQDRRDVGFLFVGRGSEASRYAASVARLGLDNVIFHEEIDPDEIPGLLAQCHVALLALDPRHSLHNIPGKFLTYMRAGLPVLARINPGNDLETLIREENVGRVCVGADVSGLSHLAEDLLSLARAANGVSDRAAGLWKRRFSSPTAVCQIVRALSDRESRDRERSA